jgi:hypothetical protein
MPDGRPPFPHTLAPHPTAFPEEMRHGKFVVWRYAWKEKDGVWGWRKDYYFNPCTHEIAHANNPATGGTLDEAIAAYRHGDPRGKPYQGIAYLKTADDGLLLADCDACRNPDGTIADWALPFLQNAGWCETSVSDTGIHAVFFATPPWLTEEPTRCYKVLSIPGAPPIGGKEPQIELLYRNRYLVMTGIPIPGLGTAVTNGQEAVGRIWTLYGPQTQTQPNGRTPAREPSAKEPKSTGNRTADDGVVYERISPPMSDKEVLHRATTMGKHAAKFTQWMNTVPADTSSHHREDYFLAAQLLFFTQDLEQVERLMRAMPRAAVRRARWDERRTGHGMTWLQYTIKEARRRQTRFYDPDYYTTHEPEPTEEGPLLWAKRGPLSPDQARAMDHEELVTFAVLCSAWISDMTNVLRHPDQNPTDKAVNLVARIEANRTPSLVYEEPWVKANAGRIARRAGVSPSTVTRSLTYNAQVGQIAKKSPRINGTKYRELYIGAPACQILPSEPIAPSEARKKDVARKKCPECGASVFVTTTACASCGLKITEHVHGDDPDAVVRKEEDLAARNAETGWTPPPLVTVHTADSTEKETPDPSTGDLEQDRME